MNTTTPYLDLQASLFESSILNKRLPRLQGRMQDLCHVGLSSQQGRTGGIQGPLVHCMKRYHVINTCATSYRQTSDFFDVLEPCIYHIKELLEMNQITKPCGHVFVLRIPAIYALLPATWFLEYFQFTFLDEVKPGPNCWDSLKTYVVSLYDVLLLRFIYLAPISPP